MLPRGYKGLDGIGPAKMAYTVTGLGHTIKENKDWVTKIDAQFIILDEPKGKLSIRDIKAIKSIVQKVEEKNIKIDAIVAVINSSPSVTTDANGNVTPPPGGGPLILPAGAAGNAAAIQSAGNSVFDKNGGTKSRCAQYSYHIGYYYTQALKGITPVGSWIGAHGNAGDALYRENLQKLGYKMTPLGVISKDKIKQYINGINTIGTIVNYKSTVNTGGNNYATIYGHTQIYTGGLLKTSNGCKWASSFGSNYNSSFVYGGKNSDSWECYLFTL